MNCHICKKPIGRKRQEYCSSKCYRLLTSSYYDTKGRRRLTKKGKQIKCTQDTQNIKKTENYLIEF